MCASRELVSLLRKSLLLCISAIFFTDSWAVAGEPNEGKEPGPIDCRYFPAEGKSSDQSPPVTSSEWLPRGDVFRPLLADPKQPRFFAFYQAVRALDSGQNTNTGSVAFGENFGLWTKRAGCDGWQVGLLGGVFAQFDLDAPGTILINADYVFGIPVSWRRGPFSARARIYHQSSHFGDEFLLSRPGFQRTGLSFEALEALLSYDYRWARLYAGGTYVVHSEQSLEPGGIQYGGELRSPVPIAVLGDVRVVPICGADFKNFQELGWNTNVNVVAGLELSSHTMRRFQFLVTYYHGFNPYGQLFTQKIESVGVGLYLVF